MHFLEFLDQGISPFHVVSHTQKILSENGFKELQFKKMESAGIDGFFKDIILSEDINICKPNRAIFEYALKTTNSLRVESIMIGDNYEVDIQGAAGAGIDQIYYCKKERLDLPMTPTFYIRSLRELKIFL